MVPFLVTLSDL